MGQFDGIIDLIGTMDKYLNEGKMKCDQIPVDDIVAFVSAEYDCVALANRSSIENYRKLLMTGILQNDISLVSSVLQIILCENRLIEELYEKKISKFDLGSELIPYKVKLQYYKNMERNRRVMEKEADGTCNPRFSGKGVVYSVITGSYDKMHTPEFVNADLDYILFTDSDNVDTDIWKVIKVENKEGLDPARLSRKIKIIGGYEYLSDYDYTIYTDGKLQIIDDIRDYIEKYSLGAPILCFNHYSNSDLYDEADACLMLGRDDPNVIRAQISRYREEGYPEDNGLVDCCMMVRDNRCEKLKNAMYTWWNEVRTGSRRDQLSFNYACWKNNVLYDTSPLISYDNKYVRTYGHG